MTVSDAHLLASALRNLAPDGELPVHFHACDDCGEEEPWPGTDHDAFCVSVGFCFRCEVLHRNHCNCLGTNLGDGCSLQPQWVTAANAGRPGL